MNEPILSVINTLFKDSCKDAISGTNRIIMPLILLILFTMMALFCNCTPEEPEVSSAKKNPGYSITVDSVPEIHEDLVI